MVRRAVAETSQTAQPWIGTGKWNTYRAVSGVHCDMQDVLCPQSCPMKCSLIITVRNIAGKINYITIDKTVKNKPNKKGTPRKRATQGHLFPRIVLLPVRLQGVSVVLHTLGSTNQRRLYCSAMEASLFLHIPGFHWAY